MDFFTQGTEIERALKIVGTAMTVVGSLGATALRVRAHRRKSRELRVLVDRVARYSLDAHAHVLNWLAMAPDGLWTDRDKLKRQYWLIYDLRNELFKADGHTPPADEQASAEIARVLKRTQAISAREAALIRQAIRDQHGQDMFREGDQ